MEINKLTTFIFNDQEGHIIIKDARLIFKNFSGMKQKFNEEGKRNFNVFVDTPTDVRELQDRGFNVRILRPRDEDELPNHVLKVNLSYNSRRPPKIYLVCNGVKTLLDEETVCEMDNAYIQKADIVVTPYKKDDLSNTTAWVSSMNIYIEPDPLDLLDIDSPEE